MGSKRLIVNNGDTCYSFISQEDKILKSEEVAYYLKYEETDTRIVHHVGQLPSATNIVVRTVDTNVVIITLGCLHQLQDNRRIWVESGIQPKINLRYISINHLFQYLKGHSAKHSHSTIPSLGVIIHLCSTEKGR